MSGIHHGAEEHRSFEVPGGNESVQNAVHSNDGAYEFYRNLLVVKQVCSLEDDTERALSNLLAHAIVNTNDVRRRRSHCDGCERAKSWVAVKNGRCWVVESETGGPRSMRMWMQSTEYR